MIHSSRTVPTPSRAPQQKSAKETEARTELLRWVVQDHFKSRLAIIHAGALYWNIRRYRYSSPVESFAIYLATLVIWAYGMGSSGFQREESRISSDNLSNSIATNSERPDGSRMATISASGNTVSALRPTNRTPGTSTPIEPSFLHLDRPVDDELVQLFVKEGNKMSGYMVHVGDIRGPNAAEKVLREGARLLTDQKHQASQGAASPHESWGAANEYAKQLEALADISGANKW